MTAEEILTKAAIILQEEGWTKGNLRSKSGSRCVLGAIYKVVSIENEVGERYVSQLRRQGLIKEKCKLALSACRLLLKRIGEYKPRMSINKMEERITLWNDGEYRIGKEVIDVCLGKK